MSLFRIVEGTVSTRPGSPLGYAASEALQSAAADVLFDLGGLRKDVHIECDQIVVVKFNAASNPGITLAPGVWDVTDEYASKVYATFTVPTNFALFANG